MIAAETLRPVVRTITRAAALLDAPTLPDLCGRILDELWREPDLSRIVEEEARRAGLVIPSPRWRQEEHTIMDMIRARPDRVADLLASIREAINASDSPEDDIEALLDELPWRVR